MIPQQNRSMPAEIHDEAVLRYVVEMVHDLRGMLPARAGPVLPHLLDLMSLEASEIAVQFAAERMMASLLAPRKLAA